MIAPAFERPVPARANLHPWPWGRLSHSRESRPSEEEHFSDYRSSQSPFPRYKRPWSLTCRDISGVFFCAPHFLIFDRACHNNTAYLIQIGNQNNLLNLTAHRSQLDSRSQNRKLIILEADSKQCYMSRACIIKSHWWMEMSTSRMCVKNFLKENESWFHSFLHI